MDDLSDYDLDEDFNNYEAPHFYNVSLCFSFMDMEDCITFEMVADGKVEDEISLVQSLIEGYDGISQMEDGTIVNLNQYVNAFVVESTDNPKHKVKSKFEIVH